MLHFPALISSLDPTVAASMDPSRPKARKHPGIMNLPAAQLPLPLRKAILSALSAGGYDIGNMKARGKVLAEKLALRHPPWTKEQIEMKRRELAGRIMQEPKFKDNTEDTSEEAALKLQRRRDASLSKRMKEAVHKWNPIDYDTPEKCFEYVFGRLSQDFAIVRRVLREIQARDPEFRPNSLLDFGSGVGSCFWVVNEFWKDVQDYIMVDTSSEMIDLAQLLLKGGDKDAETSHPGVFSRQFLGVSGADSRDLVVSAFTMMELPSQEERSRIIQALWDRTNKYLVIIENGSYQGTSCVLYARDLILAGGQEIAKQETLDLLDSMDIDKEPIEGILRRRDLWESQKLQIIREKIPDVQIPTLLAEGHVFAPCAHDMRCPRQALNDPIPCHFVARYYPLSLNEKVLEELKSAKFSFVIMKKGKAPAERWPRIVRNVLIRNQHAHVRQVTMLLVLTITNHNYSKSRVTKHYYVKRSLFALKTVLVWQTR